MATRKLDISLPRENKKEISRKKKVLLVSWVNPNLVPPFHAISSVLIEKGYDTQIITTNSKEHTTVGDESNILFIEFSPSDSFLKRQCAKWKFLRKIRTVSNNFDKAIVFDNMAFVFANFFFKEEDIFYNILELFDVSIKNFLKSPIDSIFSVYTIYLIRRAKGKLFSIPSPERIDWFSKKYKIEKKNINLIYNAPYVNKQIIYEVDQRNYTKDKPVIIHTGGVNHTRSVIELIKGFEAMSLPAQMVITNVKNDHYCQQLRTIVKSSPKKRDISLYQFLPYDDLVTLRKGADIGVCLMKPNNYDSQNIAPNKVGEYLSSGLFLLVSENSYYASLMNTGVIYQTKSLEPEELAEALDLLVKKVISTDDTTPFKSVLSWYSMNKQAMPILNFLDHQGV